MKSLTNEFNQTNIKPEGIAIISPKDMDDKINDICKRNDLIKVRLLEAIGSTRYRYASKLKFNGISKEERDKLNSTLKDLSVRAKNYAREIFTMSDHYEGLHAISESLGIKRQVFCDAIGKRHSYLNEILRTKRTLNKSEVEAISARLEQISANLKSESL